MTQPHLRDLDDDALALLVIEQRDGTVGREAAQRLFGRYQLRVYHWCYRHVRQHERALVLAQDVLTGAWRALERFDGREPFGGWLFAIAHDRCSREPRPGSPPANEATRLDGALHPQLGTDALKREFLAGDAVAPESEADAAAVRLTDLVRDLARARRSGEGLLERTTRWWNAPSVRPAMALAALLLVGGGVAVAWRITHETPAAARGIATRAFEVRRANKVPGGHELEWDPVDGAEFYQVHILRPDLTELRALPPTAETRIIVPADSIPGSFAPVGLLAFRVTAIRAGAPIALSHVGTLRR